jgi:hypothetical protein
MQLDEAHAHRQGLHKAPDYKPGFDLSSVEMQFEQQIDILNSVDRRPVL